jgi:hypothetical protein
MQTMDAHLAQLVRMGRITRQLADQRASVPEELKRLLGPVPGTVADGQGQMDGQATQIPAQPVGAVYRA